VLGGEAETIGIAELRSMWTIELMGLGKRYSGNWLIYRVRHTIDGNGYKCDMTLIRNALPSISAPLDSAAEPGVSLEWADEEQFHPFAVISGEVEDGSITDKKEIERILFGVERV